MGNGTRFQADSILVLSTNLKFAFLNLVTQNSDKPPSTYFKGEFARQYLLFRKLLGGDKISQYFKKASLISFC